MKPYSRVAISVVCICAHECARGSKSFLRLYDGKACWLQACLPPVQVVQSKILNENMERKLRGNSQYLANLEARLQHEIVKAAPLLTSNLDALPTAQLQQLVTAQEDALKRARSMLVNSLSRYISTCAAYMLRILVYLCTTVRILHAASQPESPVQPDRSLRLAFVSCMLHLQMLLCSTGLPSL